MCRAGRLHRVHPVRQRVVLLRAGREPLVPPVTIADRRWEPALPAALPWGQDCSFPTYDRRSHGAEVSATNRFYRSSSSSSAGNQLGDHPELSSTTAQFCAETCGICPNYGHCTGVTPLSTNYFVLVSVLHQLLGKGASHAATIQDSRAG